MALRPGGEASGRSARDFNISRRRASAGGASEALDLVTFEPYAPMIEQYSEMALD